MNRGCDIVNAKQFIKNYIVRLFVLPYMSKAERQFIESHMHGRVIFEFGSGGSTTRFSKLAKKYYSVEDNFQWFEKMRKMKPKAELFFATSKENYIKTFLECKPKAIDIFFVDGNWRIECLEEIYKHGRPGALVFLHDWGLPDRDYSPALKLFKMEKLVGTMALMKAKSKA